MEAPDARIDWERIYRENKPAVLSALARSIPPTYRSHIDPEDIYQDAFLSLSRNHPDFLARAEDAGKIIMHVAMMRLIDHTRMYSNRYFRGKSKGTPIYGNKRRLTVNGADLLLAHYEQDPVLDVLCANDLADRIKSSVSEDQARFIDLKIEGYSTPEASAKIGWTERMGQRFVISLSKTIDDL